MKKISVIQIIFLIGVVLTACAGQNVKSEEARGQAMAQELSNRNSSILESSDLEGQNANVVEEQSTVNCSSVQESEVSSEEADDQHQQEYLDQIIQTDPAYAEYNKTMITKDYDEDGIEEYFIVFTKKGTSTEDPLDYCADLWYCSKQQVKQVLSGQYILPNTYGNVVIGEGNYFRYDLSYATENQTVLLKPKMDGTVDTISIPGEIKSDSDHFSEFAVLHSTYDLAYSKSDGFYSGHTWKNYYFYADSVGIHEYGARIITPEEFQEYKEADTILNKLNQKYAVDGNQVTYEFLKRSNGLLHINCKIETQSDITNYYATYQIGNDGSLNFVEEGEGSYLTEIDKEVAVY